MILSKVSYFFIYFLGGILIVYVGCFALNLARYLDIENINEIIVAFFILSLFFSAKIRKVVEGYRSGMNYRF